jgi:surface antigen
MNNNQSSIQTVSNDADPAAPGRFARRVAAAVLVPLAAVSLGLTAVAGPAEAAAAYGPYLSVASPSLNERSAPTTAATVVGSLAYHSSIEISCQTSGSLVVASTVWDKLTNGDFISDYWTNTPGQDTWTAAIPRCAATQPSPPPTVRVGRTAAGNEGTAGQCTYWAIEEFHAYSGRYPYLIDPADDGDARYWATNAAYDGWTVSPTPRVDSIVVFPPGVNGALSDGHVAWVTRVSGSTITFTEMNGPSGPYNVDTRTVTPASTVRYILAP